MGSRLDLQSLLEEKLGSEAVYFQPPPSVSMTYPCIVYSLSRLNTTFAGDLPYNVQTRYTLIVIDKNPDSIIPGKIVMLPMCVFDRYYAVNGLNHYVFDLYF